MSYQLRRNQTLGANLRRICGKQVEGALEIVRGEREANDTPVHAPKPERAIKSAYSILRKNGRIAVLDLLSHSFERARELYADHWLGFSEVQLHQLLEEAQFKNIDVRVVSREKQSPHFQTVFATGVK